MNQLSIPFSFYFNFATLEACCEPTTILFLEPAEAGCSDGPWQEGLGNRSDQGDSSTHKTMEPGEFVRRQDVHICICLLWIIQ
jgi:hypothetical protein